MAIKKDQEPAAIEPESTAPPAGAASVATQAAPEPQPAPEKKTPAEWAAQLGHTKAANPKLPEMQRVPFVLPAYAVADKLYGWSDRAYNYQDPKDAFRITEATYRAALQTAMQFPATELTTGALTPEAAERHRDFKPATNLKVERAKAEAEAKQAAKAAEKA